jgi:hypothetical protein
VRGKDAPHVAAYAGATMPRYLVTRPALAADAAELGAALARLQTFEDRPGSPHVRWLHSYGMCGADGRYGLVCVFDADGVPALQSHAGLTRLPAREVLPVAVTLPVRAFAPTRVYLVRRRSVWPTVERFDASAAIARRVADGEMPLEVVWLHSYAVHEEDGTLGTFCLYQAVGPDALREHAARAGMPADEILPVLGRVVFRDDAVMQEEIRKGSARAEDGRGPGAYDSGTARRLASRS